jgi:adenylate cyclase
MAVLEAALERARSGSGQALGVMAEAGTGKSRLCAEFIDGCRAQGIPILEARGVAHGKSIPMLPMLELWRAFYEVADGDSPEATRAKIAGRLLMMDEGYREVLPVVFDVFGVPDPDNPAPAMSPELRQKRLHGVVKRILHDPGYRGTRVFLLEDLHWFDGASDGFLETIVESTPATNDLLLLNFRPEYQASWMQRSYYQQLALQPLDPEAIRALLRDQLGDDPSVRSLPEAVHEHTAGNPFFIEEVVQSLVESGHLVGERGAYRLTTQIDALEVPASVQAVLAARIDRLPEREKQVLQTAAVIGKTFAETLLREVVSSISSLDEVGLGEALGALTAAEFLFEASLYPELEYSFKHPLTQEVALGSQLSSKKVRVNAAVAKALEEAEENLDERAAAIAQHWAEAEEPGRAAGWYRRAAGWASLSDVREGLGHWRRVHELTSLMPEGGERDELALEACAQLTVLGWRMGGSEEESARIFSEGRELAERLGDRHTLARLVGSYGLMRAQRSGSASDYIRYGEEGSEIAAELGDPALRAGIGTYPAFGHFYAGRGNDVLAWSSRVLEDTGSDGTLGRDVAGYSPRPAMLHARTAGLMFLGRLDEAWDGIALAARAADDAEDAEVRGWTHMAATVWSYTAGDPGASLEEGRRGLEIAEQLDNESSRMVAHLGIAHAHLADAQPGPAREAALESIAIAREHSSQLAYVPTALAMLAQAHLGLGEYDETLEVAREGVELARECSCPYPEAQSELMLAAGLLGRDGGAASAEIEAALTRAEQLVESLEARSLSPRILEQRARLAAAVGDLAARDSLREQAIALYRDIGASGHAARLAAETDD